MADYLEKVDENDHVELYVPSEVPNEIGVPRFDFQRGAVRHSNGFVVNAGCNEDAGGLKAMAPERVINVDLHAFDEGMNRPNLVDKVFDITKPEEWEREFAPNSVELVVFGDVLEHFGEEQIKTALKCAHRIATRICITIPEDHRISDDARYVDGIYNEHVTVATEELLRRVMSGMWKPFAWFSDVHWGFNDDQGKPVLGHCIEAHRI